MQLRSIVISLNSLIIAFSLSVPLVLAQPQLKAGHPERYIVKTGDTLWDIASRFLEDPWLWPEIWHINKQVQNPHLIFPGDVLGLIKKDGKMQLVKIDPRPKPFTGEVIHLHPSVQVRDLDAAIPTFSANQLSPFMLGNQIVSAQTLQNAPYILSADPAYRLYMGTNDTAYVRGYLPQATYGVFRKGMRYIDPDTKAFLGLEAIMIGAVSVVQKQMPVSTVLIEQSRIEIKKNDKLLPTNDAQYSLHFALSFPDRAINGKIIGVPSRPRSRMISRYDVVVINRGSNAGALPGHILGVYTEGERVKDTQNNEIVSLPQKKVGALMIFRTFQRLSYAIILGSSRQIALFYQVQNLKR